MSVDKIQEAFDYGMENGEVFEVHQLMEAFDAGYSEPADVFDHIVLVQSGIVSAEDYANDIDIIRGKCGDID